MSEDYRETLNEWLRNPNRPSIDHWDTVRVVAQDEIARLRAEVETWRNRYESACLDRDVAEAKVAGDWPNALVEAQRDRAESAEARVAELEAAARRLISAWDSDTQRGITTAEDNLRALLAPREPTATLSQPTSFDGTFGGEVLPLDAYSSVTPEDVALLARGIGEPCGTCGGSGSVWDGPAGVHISDGNAMKPCPECRPKPCGMCGGSGQVGVMRVEIVRDENGDPGGEWVGDSEPCPECRGGEESR